MRVTVGLWRCALQTLGAERAAYGSGDGHEAGVALAALAPSVCQAMLCAAQGCRPPGGVEHLFYPWCRLFERAWDSPRAGSACLLHRLAEAAAYIMLRAALLLAGGLPMANIRSYLGRQCNIVVWLPVLCRSVLSRWRGMCIEPAPSSLKKVRALL